jgi:hypothetical protein
MIKNQKKFIEYLKSTSDILSSISIIDKSKIDTYIEQIKNTELIVPLETQTHQLVRTLVGVLSGEEMPKKSIFSGKLIKRGTTLF